MDDAYAEAQKPGGKHHGFYNRNKNDPASFIRHGIHSLELVIAEHEEKLRDPTSVRGFTEKDPREQEYLITRHWPDEIVNCREQIAILRSILEERNERSR